MTLQVAITADNQVFIGSELVDEATLETRFRDAVSQDTNVELHLKADRDSRYESVAKTMSTARRTGIGKIGFVTQPGEG